MIEVGLTIVTMYAVTFAVNGFVICAKMAGIL